MKTKNKVNIYIMSFIDYENFKNNNNKQVLLRVPKGLILVMSEENRITNPDTVNKMLIQDLNLMEHKDEIPENNCKMLNEAVYNKFYDIMVANRRKPSVTRKRKSSQKKKSKNKTRNSKK